MYIYKEEQFILATIILIKYKLPKRFWPDAVQIALLLFRKFHMLLIF